MPKVDVYLSLGSNIGDRKANIEKALEMMDEKTGVHYLELSDIIETEAWGFSSENFLNCAVLYRIETERESTENAKQILKFCKEIERNLGRKENLEYDEEGNRIYHSRIIDIDILFYGNRKIETKDLIVPHPLISQRDFVKIPLRQIAKDQLKTVFSDLFSA